MRLPLLHFFFSLLVILFAAQTGFAQPQPADCNVCNCNVLGGPLGTNVTNGFAIAAPGPGITTNGSLAATSTFKAFGTLAGAQYRVYTCGPNINTVIHITDNAGTIIPAACDDDGCGSSNGASSVTFVATATGASTYRAYVYLAPFCSYTFVGTPINVYVYRFPTLALPSNDEPCGATVIPSPLANNCATTVSGTTAGATTTSVSNLGIAPLVPSGLTGACNTPLNYAGYAQNDVWFQVVVPPSGLLGIQTTDGSICAGAFGLYTTSDNTCTGTYQLVPGTGGNAGLCSIEGVNAPGGTDAGVVLDMAALGVPPNTTVFIRYWERNGTENGDFQICAYDPTPVPNDDPCGSTLLTASTTCNLQEFNNINSFPVPANMTISPAITCTGPMIGVGDVWFRVIVPPSGAMTVQTTQGTLNNMAMAWYRLTAGTICGPGTLSATLPGSYCNNDQVPVVNLMPRINSQSAGITLVPGETIYIRLWNNGNKYQGTFNICVVENLPPPNDNPCGAISLLAAPTCEPVSGTTESASPTPAAFPGGTITGAVPACAGAVNTDVWYYVDVPSDLTAPFGIAFQTLAGILVDGAFQLYTATGSCATNNLTLNPIGACTAGSPMPNLVLTVGGGAGQITPGQRIYVRMWRQVAPDGTFTLCAVRTDPVPCVGSATDPGGPVANYDNNQNVTTTYCSSKVGDVVTLTFSAFNLESGWDYLYIYDGPTVGAPLIGVYTGTNSPGVVTATTSVTNPTGCLTLRFTSDVIISAPGYIAKITCSPPLPVSANPPGLCGDYIYDPGGVSANYTDNIGTAGNPIWTQTICPALGPGEVVTLHFLQSSIEANWDHLYIYDGPNSTYPLINSGNDAGIGPATVYGPGAWWGNAIPDISATVANGGCLTLVFVTDFSVTGNWTAQVQCGLPPPPPPPPGTTCGTTWYDPGGFNNYGNNINTVQTICAPFGQVVNMAFTGFNLEGNWDGLYIYDGPNTAAPLISSGGGAGIGPIAAYGPGFFSGTNSPGTIISSGQCLTFRFVTDASVTYGGWRAPITCGPASPNDNPCSAGIVTLPVNPTCTYTAGNNSNASGTVGIPDPGCGYYNGADVWYRFTTPPSGEVLITTQAGTLTDGAMAVYSAASCVGPFTMVECDDDDGPGNMPEIDRRCNPLAPSTVYYVRVWGYSGARGNYGICITGGYPAEPQGDCLGAFTLCTGDPVTAGFANPGCTNDLNNLNWGCLAGGERIGSWYAFAANTSGTLGMTITPSGNEDYDWAIWGPYPAGNTMSTLCPLPIGAPKRCSFTSSSTTYAATGSYNTGMGNVLYAGPQYGFYGTAYTDVTDGWTPGFSAVNVGEIFIMFVNDYHHTGSGYSVTWQMGSPNMLDCMILPVELLELEAHPRTSTVDLTWSTASENNSSHFVVQRSGDGERFEQIGTVTAAGTTQQLTRYAFTDQFPLMGVNYYRLTQVDFDGAAALSNTVSAEFKQRTEVIVVPNPAHDNAELVFSETQEQLLIIRITDSGGRAVGELRSSEGVQRVTLPIEKLERGTYFVRVTTADGAPRGVVPFVKQ